MIIAQISELVKTPGYSSLTEHQPNETMSDDELEQLAPWNENVKAEIQHQIESQNDQ